MKEKNTMLKSSMFKVFTICILPLVLCSCATAEPASSRNGNMDDDKYIIDCSGALLTIQTCRSKAADVCDGRGFTELAVSDRPHSIGISRNMTIMCKKNTII